MDFLIDSNVLCRIVRPDDPQHLVARQAIEALLTARHSLLITPQVEREFWAVATRPREHNGLGLTGDEADAHRRAIAQIASFVPDSPAVHENWRRLVIQYRVLGKKVHDASHVAAMLAHGVRDILTFDAEDFRRYDQLISIHKPDRLVTQQNST